MKKQQFHLQQSALQQDNITSYLKSQNIQFPQYDRLQLKPKIVHIGLGNFHRAHQAMYIDSLNNYLHKNNQNELMWGICGIGIKKQDERMKQVLPKQDNLYTLMIRQKNTTQVKIIGSIIKYIYGLENQKEAIEQIASQETLILSTTVTEKGYNQDPLTGNINLQDKEVMHDIQNLFQPITTAGFIVAGLCQRKLQGKGGITIMNCDNIQENGNMLKKVILTFAQQIDKELNQWISDNVVFVNSMLIIQKVDRITPKTSEQDIHFLEQNYGIYDEFPVKTEEFIQWVIEDKFFSNIRPKFEYIKDEGNILLVDNVVPYELMKLRLLNGSHVSLSFSSDLLGYYYVHDAMANTLINKFVEDYLDEVTCTVPKVHIDLQQYKKQLIIRYLNPSIGDQIPRLAMDGQQKYSEWIGPVLKILIEQQKNYCNTAFSVASWYAYLYTNIMNNTIQRIDDPQKNILINCIQSDCKKKNKCNTENFLSLTFDNIIAKNSDFNNKVHQFIKLILDKGIEQALKQRY